MRKAHVTMDANDIALGFADNTKEVCIALGCIINGKQEYIGGQIDFETFKEFLKTLTSVSNQ